MTKCRIIITTNRSFDTQNDAREYLKQIVHGGCLFVKCFSDGDKTSVTCDQTTYCQTIGEARIRLKDYVDAGILYIEVKKGHEE